MCLRISLSIRLSEKFLSFYKEIIDAQCFFILYWFIELYTNIIIDVERNGSCLIQ